MTETETFSLAAIRAGGKRAMAEALSRAEHSPFAPALCAGLDEAWRAAKAHVIGITGPPGVGKSTLIEALLRQWRGEGKSVGVLAVDPSSRLSGGALLGDRIRMRTAPGDEGVFIRSYAARRRLGGLSDEVFAAMALMRAVYDRVIVETVGVGQSEADIGMVADSVVLCIQPGSGDALQFMKAGIMEIPHIAVVTKADTGAPARAALSDLKSALALGAQDGRDWVVPCLTLSAMRGEGVTALIAAADAHWRWLTSEGRLEAARAAQAREWAGQVLAARFGSEGLRLATPLLGVDIATKPFAVLAELLTQLHVELR